MDADLNRPPLERRDRLWREQNEAASLSPVATRSAASKGREVAEEPDDLRTAFEQDRDRILHAKAFRRLKHKTQVFLNPEGDHYVTRLTHTLQVAQVGRSIAVALGLNEPLAEAICLGHDLGHSPFGHTGEDALSPFMAWIDAPMPKDLGARTSAVDRTPRRGSVEPDLAWQHAIQSVRIVRKLEPLNLTWETLDGIRGSSWRNDPPPATPEGMVCRYADRIAYLAHDAVDAMRAGVLKRDEVPTHILERFGEPGSDWVHAMVTAVVNESAAVGEVTMQEQALQTMHDLRRFMFQHVYLRHDAESQRQKAIKVIVDLVEHFAAHADEIPTGYVVAGEHPVQQAVDHVAGMSDSYAIAAHDRLFRPRGLY